MSKPSKVNTSSSNMTLMSVAVMMSENDHDFSYVDNGATNHVTLRQDLFRTHQSFVAHQTVTTTDGDSMNLTVK